MNSSVLKRFEFPDMPSPFPEPLDLSGWRRLRAEIKRKTIELFGEFPGSRCELRPTVLDETACGGFRRLHIRFNSEPDDLIYAYLLIPDRLKAPAPAVIAIHTSASSGKDCTVGLAGLRPGEPPDRNLAYALDAVAHGCVALAPDMDTIGERAPGGRFWDTQPFYRRCPRWSAMGKIAWDISRCVDYLIGLDYVDAKRIACMGHCFGGYATVYGSALDERIRAVLGSSALWTFRTGSTWFRDPDDPREIESARRAWGPQAGVYIHIPRLAEYVGKGWDEIVHPLPVDYYEIACLLAPRLFYVSIPSADIIWLREGADPQAAARQQTLSFQICSAIRRIYTLYNAAQRFELWTAEGEHTWKAESKERAFAFLDNG